MSQSPGIDAALNTLIDLGKAIVNAVQSDGDLATKLSGFSKVIPDFMSLYPLFPGLKNELANIQLEDYPRWCAQVATGLGLTSPHAQAIVKAFVKLANSEAISDVVGLVNAITQKPAQAA